MTLAHLHLLLNHVPTVGSVLALGLLLLSFVRRSAHVRHVALELLFVIALLTLPVYITGVAAYRELGEQPGFSDEAMRVHQDIALAGFVVTEFAGFLAWVALWQTRRRGRPGRGLVPAVTVLLVVALAVMGRAANLGGEIRHEEIRADASAEAGLVLSGADDATGEAESPAPAPQDSAGSQSQFVAAEISRVMVYSTWVWPASECVHFLGLALSIGVLLAVNLRMLGVMRQVAFADLHRLLPWGMLGFGVNLITGMLFFVGQPGQYVESAPFYWKIAFLMVAGVNFLYLTVFGNAWGQEQSSGRRFEARLSDKAMAVTSIAAWFGILWAGRMLPFLGDAF